jgi:hypothetical protein
MWLVSGADGATQAGLQSCPCSRARPLGGGCGSSPRWVRIFSSTGRSRMAAMILSSPPPQFGQRCMSISNTRLSSRAQLTRCGGAWTGSASHPAATAASVAACDRCFGGRLRLCGRLLRHHQRAQLRVRRQHAVEPVQVQHGPQHQRRQPLQELQRPHHQVRGPVAPRRLELELHLPCGVELHAFVGQRWPGDAADSSAEDRCL